MKILSAFAAGSVLLAAASTAQSKTELKIDGSTEDTTTASVDAMMAEHSNREKCLLQTAVIQIALGEKDKADAAGKEATPVGQVINGKTYREIVALSQKYPPKVRGLCRD